MTLSPLWVILQSIEDLADNPFQHQTGYRVDACIKNNLPHLLSKREIGFAKDEKSTLKDCPVECTIRELMGREEIDFTKEKLMTSAGKYSGVRWEHYAYVKGGAGLGENVGRLTEYTFQQLSKADEIATSFLGNDLSILEPGAYSKVFCTPLQNSLKWNKDRMMWATSEDAINPTESVTHSIYIL